MTWASPFLHTGPAPRSRRSFSWWLTIAFPWSEEGLATSTPMTEPFLSRPIKQRYATDCACHVLEPTKSPERETQPIITFILCPRFAEFQWRNVCPKYGSVIHSLRGASGPPFGSSIIESMCLCFPRNFTESYCPPCCALTYEIHYLYGVSHLLASIFKDRLPSWDSFWFPFNQEGGFEMPDSQVFPCQTGTWDLRAPSLQVKLRLICYQMSMCHIPPIQEQDVSTNQVIRTQKGSQVSSEGA